MLTACRFLGLRRGPANSSALPFEAPSPNFAGEADRRVLRFEREVELPDTEDAGCIMIIGIVMRARFARDCSGTNLGTVLR
jgi:hypothetical protein